MRKIILIILTVAITGTAALLLTRGSVGAVAQLGCNPTVLTVKTGQIFYYTVAVTNTNDLYAWQFDMSFSPTYLEFIGVMPGNHLISDGASGYFVSPTATSNEVQLAAYTRLSEHVGVNGSGNIAHVFFRAKKTTSGTNSTLGGIMLLDRNALNITYDSVNSLRCKVIISDSAPVYVQPAVGFLANMPLILK